MQTKIITQICLVILLCSVQTLAQKQAPPEGSAPKDFTLPARTTFTLNNGMNVTLVQYGTLPKTVIRAVVRVGNGNEGPNEIWLSDLLGELMKEGTTTRTAKQLAVDAARLGGNITIGVADDLTNITGDVLSAYAPEMVTLMADVLCKPRFPESELTRLKNDKVRELSIAKTDPNSIALEKFRGVMYPNHAYGRIFPTEEMLQGYTVEQVRAFYDNNFGAGRTHLYVAGVFDPQKVEQAIRAAFDSWRKGPTLTPVLPQPVTQRNIHFVDRPGAPQSTVYIGLPVIDPAHTDYRGLQVVNALLGGLFISRITANIRENKGYTYSPGSSISTRYRDAYWAEFASITTSVTGLAIKEIFFEIDRLQGEPPPAEELRGIQNYMAGVFVLQNSSPAGIISQLAFLNLHGLPDSYLTDYVKTIYSVTPELVSELAKKYLRDEEMTIVIAGDKKTVQKQVAPFGKVVG